MGKYLELARQAVGERQAEDSDFLSRNTAYGEKSELSEESSALAEALANAIQIRHMREKGEIPQHYTATTLCDGCGWVPIFPGVGERVKGCPWCFNRISGLPVPRVRG